MVLLGTQLLSIVWAGFVLAAVFGDGPVDDPLPITIGLLANVGLWLGYGIGPLVVAGRKGLGAVGDYGARLRRADLPLGLLVGVAMQALILPLLYWPILRVVDGDPGESAKELIDSLDGPVDWLLITLSVAVIAPLVEELFFRGLLLRAVHMRFGTVAAVVTSAVVFAAVHRLLLPFPGLFLFGIVAAFLTLGFGRLGPAWAMHVGFNTTTLVVLGLGL